MVYSNPQMPNTKEPNLKENNLYNEDCLETMARMEDDFVDLVITSPPYDDLRHYNGYDFPFEKIASQLKRILKPGAVLLWVVADKTEGGSETGSSFRQALHFMDIGLNLHDTMIYYKNNPMPTAGDRYHQHFEYMFALSKGKPKTFNPIMEPTKHRGIANMKNRGVHGSLEYKKIDRTQEKKVGNVFFYSVGGGLSTKDKVAYRHPAIFPEQLVRDQLITWTNKGDLVYDPFLGSGTTAKVAALNHRRWIGSEISVEYFRLAKERLGLHLSNKYLLPTNG